MAHRSGRSLPSASPAQQKGARLRPASSDTSVRAMAVERRYGDEEMVRLMQQGIQPIESEISGKHAFDVRSVRFVIDKRYEIQQVLGMGAYGLVVSAIDKESEKKVAVKKVSNLCDNIGDAKRILREIRLMRFLKHDQILKISDMEVPENVDTFNEIYIVSPLFDKDLEHILRAGVDLKDEHIQFFVYQMLCALKYMHSASILHRDLKPANILVQESCDLVLCDLGLARYIHQTAEKKSGALTEYVVTRWYRAPELVLCGDGYGTAVDMWAIGCILGEMLAQRVIFPGKDFRHQVELICDVIGKPSTSDCSHIESAQARAFVDELPDSTKTPFEGVFEGANPDAIDLVRKLLVFDPSKRISAEQALNHPYLADYHDVTMEPAAPIGVDNSWLEPEGEDGAELTVETVRVLLMREISHFRPNDPLFKIRPDLLDN